MTDFFTFFRSVMDVIRVFSFVLLFLLGYTTYGHGRATFAPPRIIYPDESEYIISTGENFTLRCEGREPINWTYPDNTEYNDVPPTSTITIHSSTTPDSEYTHGSILTIHNASFMDTGYYYCHKKGTTDFNDLSSVSSVYIFVNDPEKLSIISDMFYTITATQYSRVVLPCRTTSPDVNVELFQITGDEVHLNIPDENGIIVTYDPREGFIISEVTADHGNLYECRFFRNGILNNATIVLTVFPITDSIAKPYIEELSGGHTVVGEKLELKCTLKVSVQFIMEWITPNKNESGHIHVSRSIKESHDMYYQKLTIEHATLDDQGEYTCVVKDNNHMNNNSKFIRIFDTSEHFINLSEPNGVYDILTTAGDPHVQWRIDVKAHPLPKLTWYDNRNEEIVSGWSDNKNPKYEIRTESSTEAFLKINDVVIGDRGFYTLKAINEFEEVSLKLFLNVTDKPTVDIKTDDFHLIGEESTVKCLVAAYPDPSIYWFYKDCENDSCNYELRKPYKTQPEGLQTVSYLNITTNKSGFVMCLANNSLGADTSVQPFLVSDVRNGFGIWGVDKEMAEMEKGVEQFPVAIGETITLYCAASRHKYTNQFSWYKNNGPDLILAENNSHYTVERSNTEFSNKVTLTIYDVDYGDSGNYTCQVKEKPNSGIPNTLEQLQTDTITIEVKAPTKPIIFQTNLNNSDKILKYKERLELWCYARGIPKPSITWYKDGVEQIEAKTESKIFFEDNNQRLIIPVVEEEDESLYECKAENKLGSIQKHASLVLENKPPRMVKYILAFIAVIAVCFSLLIYLYYRYRKERKLRRELKKAGLANFENGALDSLNPELGIDDQAELLPYDKKWEFPRDKLKLGKQLGSGAFGVVMKAEASGIEEGEETTTVAVKMVKRNAEYTYIRALASELKIMVHLGKHLNVVNLLGACTKNVVKRELLVIVEYCRFGNLHNYLLRHRGSFINQIDAKTGKIDYTFGAEILERSFSISSDKSKSQNPNLKYAALSFSNSAGNSPLPKDMEDYRGNFNYSGDTAYTASTAVSMTPTGGEDSLIASNNSVQPEWRSNYRGDYKGNVKPICTKDLITWAFQVARGMEYLASRKVLHGDLAARNILLAENNIVKICDFGLAKSMYKSDNYKKKGDGPLPVKWMAIESIRDRVFSTQSDVWSYGIVLWEFFSLARTPYPGMEADERLYNKLVDGYRMDSPEFATNEIYSMMCECWHPKPLVRPTFTKLAETIGLMLEDSVRQHYVDLNDPYLVMNTQRLENGHSDYLAMLSPPDFEHLSSPHNYVNDEIKPDANPNPNDTPGYLCMKSSHIFSPRENENNVFTFDVKHKNSNGEIATGTELLPILHTQNESDCETPRCTASPTSFSNPTYHIPPNITEKTDEDIVKTADNYVNMPQNKSAIKNEKTLNNGHTNPSTNSISNNYVNSNSRDWESVQV